MSRKPPDFDLWTEVARSVQPLKHSPAHKVVKHVTHNSSPRAGTKVSALPLDVLRPTPRIPPPITGFDRRTTQKLSRGNVKIERHLDLHGLGIELARVKLLGFLRDVRAEGLRTVLVITGKGNSPFTLHTLHGAGHFHSPEREGRLRRQLTEWLYEPEFRSLVTGFQPAHPKHGGGGAFYVKLRRDKVHL